MIISHNNKLIISLIYLLNKKIKNKIINKIVNKNNKNYKRYFLRNNKLKIKIQKVEIIVKIRNKN